MAMPLATEKSIGELLAELNTESGELIRKEIQLARVEIDASVNRLRASLEMTLLGGGLASAGFLALVAAAVLGLDVWLQQPWLSALLVGTVVTIIGAILASRGLLDTKQQSLKPQRSLQSLQRDGEMLQRNV